ncbi:MAG TPA: ABC transporter permease [Gemmatimonadaceae bacterium]|nr:ABC transporter permease [Gemmatimonadaceae bacterium]
MTRPREENGVTMETLLQDIRYALRTLRRNIGFTAAAVLTLALGLGANAAIFGIVNGVLLRPLPYGDPDRLVMVWGKYPEFGRTSTSLPDFLDWREGARSFESMAASHGATYNLTGTGEPEQLRASRVTANFFGTLGVQPALGRGFTADEDRGGDDFVAVLSHGLWQRRFGGDRAILGRTIQLSGRPYTVIGVAPEGFRFGDEVDLWTPTNLDMEVPRRAEFLTVFGRLKPGVTVERANAELAGVLARLAREYPQTNATIRSEVVSMQADFVGDVRTALLVFSGAVGLVLLIACANVANLLLARATAREREMAVRTAIGAGRGRIVRQLLTESVVIALLGAALGLVIAVGGVGLLRGAGTEILPRIQEVRVDGAVILFSLALALLTGLLFGLAPAMRLSRGALHDSLKEGARGAAGGAATRIRNALVLSEVALALVLLVGAGLLVRSFERLHQVDLGFEPGNVLTYELVLPSAKFGDVAQLPAVYDELVERTRAIPGVSAVAVSDGLPMGAANYLSFTIEGRTPPPDAFEDIQPFSVTPGHFSVLRIPLRAGRVIEERDDAGTPAVAVVNEELVRRFFEGRDPIGRRITFGNPSNPETTWMTIVGVVGNVAQEGVTAAPYPQLYRALRQDPRRGVFVTMRTTGDPTAVASAARQALRAVDPELPLTDLMTMQERVSADLARPRVSVALLGIFAGIALLLAAIGIYGVISYAVAQRTREIGIRMALGASTSDVRKLVVRQGMAPALAGIALGIVGALAATRVMSSLLYGVSATDPVTFAGVPVLLAMIALAAAYLPARRATRVEPVNALRSE